VDAPVIIVGGGPTGLSLALGLAHHGVRSIVLERAAEAPERSRAFVLWPRTAEVLRDWNAWDALRAAGTFVPEIAVFDAATGQRSLGVDFRVLDETFNEPGALLLAQSRAETILRDLVRANPLCDLRSGWAATDICQDDDGATVSTLDADGKPVELQTQYVAGCDGANGITREAMGVELEGVTYGMRVVVTDERVERTLGAPSFRACFAPILALGIEFEPGHWRVIAPVPKETSDDDACADLGHAARMRALFGDAATRAQTRWRGFFTIHRNHAQRFVKGRVALAGDAAHLNSPAGGQGLNVGIHDAANLAWKIAYALNGGDARKLLDSYDLERREMMTDSVENYANRLARYGQLTQSWFKKRGLNLLRRALRGIGMQRKAARGLGMLNGRYTKSPIIDARHPVAGRRVGDLRLPDGRRINEVRKGKAALLAIGNADVGEHEAIHIPALPKRWHVKSPAALVIRPDGCVASVIEKPTPEKITSAWAKAFAGTSDA